MPVLEQSSDVPWQFPHSDLNAFESLFRRHQSEVYRRIVRIVRNRTLLSSVEVRDGISEPGIGNRIKSISAHEATMFAVTGVTGNVGGVVAQALLAARQPVRAVVRDAAKGEAWRRLGCEVVQADINDAATLAKAFEGTEGVFILVPSNFDPSPGFSEAHATAAALKSALEAANPDKVVYLSTIGAQATHTNLLSQHTIIEQALQQLSAPITFLRPGWFMENSSWDVAPACESGVISSFLQPLDKPVPMVGTVDIGRVAAELLQQTWTGHRVVELEGPRRVTPQEIAATFTSLTGRPVKVEAVPRESWETLFRSQGMKNPTPRIQMLDGFNQGWIEFEHGEAGSRKGEVQLEAVLKTLVERENKK